MNIEQYLAQFNTKEEIKAELQRLQRNVENISMRRMDLWSMVANKKLALLKKYNNECCIKECYMDDLGRRHFYYKEV